MVAPESKHLRVVRETGADNQPDFSGAPTWFQALVDRGAELISIRTRSGRVKYINRAVRFALGYQATDLLDLPLSSLVHPDDVDAWERTFFDVANGSNEHKVSVRLRDYRGDYKYFVVRVVNAMTDPSIDGIVTIAVPVEPEEAGSDASEIVSLLAKQSPVAMLIVDRDGIVLSWNEKSEELFGWTEQEVVGRPVPFVPSDAQDEVADMRRRAFLGESVTSTRTRRMCKDGSTLLVSISAIPVRSANGDVVAVMGLVSDHTELTVTADELKAQRSRFESLTQNSSDIVAVVGADRKYAYLSPAALSFTGLNADEIHDHTPLEYIHPDSVKVVRDALADLESGLQSRPYVIKARRFDGAWRFLEIVAADLRHDPSVSGVVTNARDITDRVIAETERQKINEALRRSNEALTAIVESSPLAILAVDKDFKVLLWNPAAGDLFGWEPGEVSGKDLAQVWEHADLTFWRKNLEVGSGFENVESRQARKDGTPLDVSVSAAPIRDGKGNVTALLAVVADVTEKRSAELRLRASEERFRNLVKNSTDIITILEEDGTIRYASPSTGRIMGYTDEQLIGQSVFSLIHPADVVRAEREFQRQLALHGMHEAIELRIRHVDGSWRDVECVSNNLLSDPTIAGFVVTARDVTERRRNAKLIADQARILEMIAQGANLNDTLSEVCRIVEQSESGSRCAILLVDDDGQQLRVGASPSMPPNFISAIDGLKISARRGPTSAAVAMARPVLVARADTDGRWRDMEAFAQEHGFQGVWSTPVVEASGNKVLGALTVYYPESGTPRDEHRQIVDTMTHLATIALDRQAMDAHLQHQANHDPLTNLPNRSLFVEFLSLALARSQRTKTVVSVLFIDLDRFKFVNDSLGHDAGDELLISTAKRLTSVIRPGDIVARFGGDEFTILCQDLSEDEARQQVIDVADRLLDSVHQPFTLSDDDAFMSASIGIALSNSATDPTPETMLRDADAAMYRAKEKGKGRWELFDEKMREFAQHRLELENSLHRALERNEFRVLYQPIVSISGARCVGAEALVRWQHPERGLISPDDFIAMAEETGLIVPLGEWVLREVCTQLANWRDSGVISEPFKVSVNLSARQLAQPDLTGQVNEILDEYKIPPEMIGLEITESILMDDADWSVRATDSLADLGVQLSIDDFGTGYSSLGYLKRFAVDNVKVDKSFVQGLGSDAEDSVIVTAVVRMGHALGLTVVAEGVENNAQLAELMSLDCDQAQGYLFARPQLAEDLAALLINADTFPGTQSLITSIKDSQE